jgi:hypothetical protein
VLDKFQIWINLTIILVILKKIVKVMCKALFCRIWFIIIFPIKWKHKHCEVIIVWSYKTETSVSYVHKFIYIEGKNESLVIICIWLSIRYHKYHDYIKPLTIATHLAIMSFTAIWMLKFENFFFEKIFERQNESFFLLYTVLMYVICQTYIN